MSTIHPECPGSDPSDRLEAADALLRQEPEKEENDEEEDNGDGKEGEEDEHDDKGHGYSE